MAKTYEVKENDVLVESEQITKTRTYNKADIEAQIAELQLLIDKFK